VGCYGARGSFYWVGGWEGRQCGEGNGQRWRCAFKAFNPSVLGGERRGEWGVNREGKCGAISGRGGVIGVAGPRRGSGGGSARSGFRSVRGRRRAGWARKGGRRWAETIARTEIQKSKNQFLIDFWIKIGLEID
jgi:hypothetical protein